MYIFDPFHILMHIHYGGKIVDIGECLIFGKKIRLEVHLPGRELLSAKLHTL
jgi:hypothetical protein